MVGTVCPARREDRLLTPFDTFRKIYAELDSRRRTVWSMAEAKFDMITSEGGMDCVMSDNEGNRMRAKHRATAETIIEGVKAYSQFLYEQADIEGKNNPYQYVPGGHTWLNRARWMDYDAHDRASLAQAYDRRVSKLRVVG